MAADQVDVTLTSPQDQTGITTEIQNNQPEQPTEDQLSYNRGKKRKAIKQIELELLS